MDIRTFKDAMARVTGPVAIVTSYEDGVPHGTTVSSLASLSLDPAMVSVALDNASSMLNIVRRTRSFGVNILAVDQHESAARFAGPREERFAGSGWQLSSCAPRLPGTSAWLHCTVAADVAGGDHTLILGEVVDCSIGDNAPLAYSLRTFGSLTPHPPRTTPLSLIGSNLTTDTR
ncbi:flavin reductase family protein [Rhodococcus sp. EPR-157]|uniref:flavin reductase family protein n=1 Tax=Rhodococcus sp. EPR-157 TaxID=1813677 RepID=UPI000837B67C|nr:flavin reductase family protein [Rhodococcus sp. EPR-157]